MAEFKGFMCDECREVWVEDSKTRVKTTFSGFCDIGSFFRELCPNCVVPPEDARPTKKRNRKGSQEQESAAG